MVVLTVKSSGRSPGVRGVFNQHGETGCPCTPVDFTPDTGE